MKKLYLLIPVVISLFSACQDRDKSQIKVTSNNLKVYEIYLDGPRQGLVFKKWPWQDDTISQSTVAVEQHGQVWDIKSTARGLAHLQYPKGPQSLNDYAQGTLKFDMRVLESAKDESTVLIKLAGSYPERAEYKLSLSRVAADQADSINLPAECESRRAAIENAEKAGELEILSRSSDQLMANCTSQYLANLNGTAPSSWQSYAINLQDFQAVSGFSLDQVMDAFAIEFSGPMHVQLNNIRLETLELAPPPAAGPTAPPVAGKPYIPGDIGFSDLGPNVTARMEGNVAVTEGVIRVRRRHENDMDFSKYNPFYWEGRLTHFKVEDFTTAGQKRIKFTLKTEWPQDYNANRGPDFSAIYTGNPKAPTETERSKFAINARMQHIADFKHFEFTIDENWFAQFPQNLIKDRLLVFEFRFFNDESFGPWQRQKQLNQHNLSAYYSEFFRIKIGEPGLLIDDLRSSEQMPAPERYSGGWTSVPTVRVEPWKALQQQAFNLTLDNAQSFLTGRTWFHTDMVTGRHIEDPSDDKPSVFFPEMVQARSAYAGSQWNVSSCNNCHIHNGISLLPSDGNAIHTTVARTLDASTGLTHALFGEQLQTNGPDREGSLRIERYEERVVNLDDGTPVTLRKPIFVIDQAAYGTDGLAISPRKPQALIGMGLLDAVPDNQIRELAKNSTGKVSEVKGRVGRFGWKASQASVRDQIAAALKNDMGVLSRQFTAMDCAGSSCQAGKGRLPEQAMDELESYVALLGVPPRNAPFDPRVRRGEEVFMQLACQSCHVPSLKTGSAKFPELSNQLIQPYTDLLLHDMGEGLADPHGGASARQWRTAPLWGLKNVKHSTNAHKDRFPAGRITTVFTESQAAVQNNPIELLHDGRARSIPEAILWHGGDAEDAVRKYMALGRADRDALEAFLWDL
ncbi:MAG: di-heme oxidoredictase family protein [Oligoflexus sp.]